MRNWPVKVSSASRGEHAVGLGLAPLSFTGDRLIVARCAELKNGCPVWIKLLFMLKYKTLEGDVKREEETCPLKFQRISAV
ncbi:hypothetical protein EV128_1123 [Rhizobium azibense]|nr:hypothetical protein EV128_1123 [Rhizobium azibense]